MERLGQLELMCERLYNARDHDERSAAEQALQSFSMNADYIPECQFILDNSNSPYAQHLASSSLIKQVSSHSLTPELKSNIRNYVLTYLASKGPGIQSYVSSSLIQLLCRLTKLAWWDDDKPREIVAEASSFLAQDNLEFHYLGLKILNQMVQEMNQVSSNMTSTQHRKTACSFRDSSLFEIFRISLSALDRLQSSQDKLREQAVQLALKCLSFDFVGISMDESSDDLGTIQVPSAWKPAMEDSNTMKLFFDYYKATKPPISSLALECLVRLASVRRSLFGSETNRQQFLTEMMLGTRDILRNQTGLSEHNNYHECCRLLGRLKSNYQLGELINVDCYPEWIQLVADFTVKSLSSWQWASGSIFYLLGLWSRLVSSLPYLKGGNPTLLETLVPQITQVYISTRLESAQTVVQSQLEEDPLDSEEQLNDQLDNIPYLCRFQYDKTSQYLTSVMEPLLQAYQEASSHHNISESAQVQIVEGQLTWLVHIIGAIVRGKLGSSSSNSSQEALDGTLSSRVFQLIQISDSGSLPSRYQQKSKQRLDLALLSFFQNFRKAYIGDQAMSTSKELYSRLGEIMGLSDHNVVLNVIVTKAATNLKCYTKSGKVVEETLNLFQELAGGYMSGKMLLKLESVNFIMANHTREHFPFLDEFEFSRNRTTFYCTLGRLLFAEDSQSKFKAFVAPLQQVIVNLSSTSDVAFRTPIVKLSIIGLFRDLRGITLATNSRRSYNLLFDWIYPALTPLFSRALEHWGDAQEVTTPLLKFMSEFVTNKQQRLTFDSSSPNGILIFRQVSTLLVQYGSRVLQLTNPPDPYINKYKGISISLGILSKALLGNYVNFGVFELYGDPALSEALEISLKLSLSIPLSDVLAYRKLTRAFFAFFDAITQNHISVLANLDTPTFRHIITSLEAGLKALDVNISTQCCSALDNVAGFYFNNVISPEAPSPPSPAALKMASHVADCPTAFPEILKTLFEIMLFEECSNQWSLSRPMLSLILMNEQVFNELKGQLIASQPHSLQPRLAAAFDKLMADISRSLESKNRDKFTQNLTVFRHEFKAK